jgi:hypothetical protein
LHFWAIFWGNQWVARVRPSKSLAPRLAKNHVVFCKGETDRLIDSIAMLSDLLQPLVNRGIKILLTAFGAHPSWDAIHIDGLTLEMKPSLNDPLFHLSVAEFAQIPWCHFHFSPLFNTGRIAKSYLPSPPAGEDQGEMNTSLSQNRSTLYPSALSHGRRSS